MSTKPTPTEPTPTGSAVAGSAVAAPRPRRLTAAAALTALQGLALACLGVYMLYVGILGDPDSPQQAETGGITLLVLAALPLTAARGLVLGRRWSRGPAVITQVMSLPVALTLWTAGGAPRVGSVFLALAAVAVLAFLVNPTATEALGAAGPGEPTR